jgi:hypothetical protein
MESIDAPWSTDMLAQYTTSSTPKKCKYHFSFLYRSLIIFSILIGGLSPERLEISEDVSDH